MRDARSERRIRVPSMCWRRLAGAMSTCPIERRAASGRVRVGAPLKETLHLRGRRADLTGRTSLRAASGVARSGDGVVERPTAKDCAYHGCLAYRARKRPLRGLQPPTPPRSWAGVLAQRRALRDRSAFGVVLSRGSGGGKDSDRTSRRAYSCSQGGRLWDRYYM